MGFRMSVDLLRPAFASCAALLLLAACAGSVRPTKVVSHTSAASSPIKPMTPIAADLFEPDSGDGFLASETASEAAEYIRLGQESLIDSSWFEAAEYFDSAMVHLADMEINDSLSPRIRNLARAYQDSVREWLIQSVSQTDRLGEAEDLSDLLNREIEEVPESEVKDLDAMLTGLPNRDFDLPLPSPLPQPVLQALRVFTGEGRGYFTRWLQRRSRYESLISAKLAERNMPKDLLYLSMVESGFSSKAWSRKSASGLWQFISGTGRRYGLKDDWWEDPRRDPARATEAAIDYLEDLYTEFDDWNLAMAAYNCGEGRIRKQQERNPNLSYWQMSLPEETRFYVPKILAAMIIGHNPDFFGFHPEQASEGSFSFDTVTVKQCLSLRSIARVLGISEDSLKMLNPALRRWCTPPGRNSFTLNLPPGRRDHFYANADRIDVVKVSAWRRHVVGRRETMSRIASRYGISMDAIKEANQLKGTRVHRGQTLIIPVPADMKVEAPAKVATASHYKVRRGENLYAVARRFQVSVYALREANGLGRAVLQLRAGKVLRIPVKPLGVDPEDDGVSQQPALASTRHKVHVVRKGETLYSIARRFGVKPEDLRSWNGLKSADLTAGQKLVYRPSATAVVTPDSSRPPIRKDEAAKIALASMDAPQYYQVKTGDNLWGISMRFGRSLDDLKKLNDNLPKTLRPGQKIRVR